MRTTFALGLILVVAGSAATGRAAQSSTAPGASSAGIVSLTLRIAEGKGPFYPGETIPIELEFASAIKDRFVVDGATYDRSGRLTIDTYRVSPDVGVVDPLLDYLGFNGGDGGGIRGVGVLGEKPFVVKLQLNDWFRFDEPGLYTLSLRSGRVSDESTGRASASVLPIESNTITIEIRSRDTGWETNQVAALVARIDHPTLFRDPNAACEALQYLGTNDAVDAMIRRFDLLECQSAFTVGLFGARDQGHVVSEMVARLGAPDQAISEGYLRTLSILTVYLEHPEFRVRPSDSKGRWALPQDVRKRQDDLIQTARAAYVARLSVGTTAKDPAARALTLASALEGAPPKDPAAREALRDQVIASFPDLPGEMQSRFLEYRWPAIASPAMAPALIALADAADRPLFGGSVLADLALHRLFAIAPADARARILAQIEDPPRGATIRTLGQLPDADLPDLDRVLALHVMSPQGRDADDLDIRAALLERYATPAAAVEVIPWFETRRARMACEPLVSLLGYVARVDPARGQELLEHTVANRAGPCHRFVLAYIAKVRMTPPVEAVAIAHLSDADPEVARFAAEALGESGSAAARAPLLQAFEAWHATWAGRADELAYRQAAPNPNAPQMMTENAFSQALTFGRGWRATSEDLERVQGFCVTSQCREQVGYRISQAKETVILIGNLDEPFTNISVAQFNLRSLAELADRLSQYQKGTAFTLDLHQLDPRVAAEATARIKRAAEQHGLTIK